MNTTKDYIFLLFLFIIVSSCHIVGHEVIHSDIMKYHECKNIDLGYNGIYAYAQCNEYNNRSVETYRQEQLLHSVNEIVGYSGFTIILYLFSFKLFKLLKEN